MKNIFKIKNFTPQDLLIIVFTLIAVACIFITIIFQSTPPDGKGIVDDKYYRIFDTDYHCREAENSEPIEYAHNLEEFVLKIKLVDSNKTTYKTIVVPYNVWKEKNRGDSIYFKK